MSSGGTAMTSLRSKQTLLSAVVVALVLFALSGFRASAQQISYYTFDTPGTTPGQYSYACTPTDTNGPTPPLFCLNYQGSTQLPTFIEDPSISDPNYSSGQWVAQMTTPAGGEASSLWFSVPQQVTNGFNVWFQFKITPSPNSYATADGLAFVIQNSYGAGLSSPNPCAETGTGYTVVGGGGGCLGYGGIDNSVALEFDTYDNSWDPTDSGSSNDNHIALQSCGLSEGTPLSNSPSHFNIGGYPSCNLSLGSTPTLISNPQTSAVPGSSNAVTLADGNTHQVVMVYNGPLDTPANYLYVYLDPAFNEGTVTPVAGSVPLFSGPFDITQYINLQNEGPDLPAYVGFTAATGSAFEQHEITGWTFTPHTQVQQSQPLPTTPTTTTFPFGTHNYSVTYPANTVPAGITMTVIATPISQTTFDALIASTPFAGSQCQIYDDTGNNCIAYNVSCTQNNNPVACPAPSGAPTDCSTNVASPNCVTLTTSYNNSVQPTTPGFLQGDPFYAPVSSINSGGTAGSVFCSGECAVTTGQNVNIVKNDATVVGQVTVTTVDSPYKFEFTSTTSIPNEYGGNYFLTSVNIQNIFVSYSTASLDGSTTGRTQNFSDFIATSLTPQSLGTQAQLSANNNPATANQPDLLTATINATSPSLIPLTGAGSQAGGTVTFYAGLTPICQNVALTQTGATTYTATCDYTPTTTPSVALSAVYTGDTYYITSTNTLNLPVNPATYQLTVTAGTGGTVTATNGAYAAGSSQPISATPSTGYYFSGWTGSADIVNPSLASTTVTMNANETIMANFTAQTTPTITWANPAAITYGTQLSGTQLNATASVLGGFLYTPAATTVLNAGANQTLHVTFTPSDTTLYTTASKTVSITVNKANQILTFTLPSTATYGVAPIALNGSATSGLPVSYLVTGPANLTGTPAAPTLTITGDGAVSVTASQAGNGNYNPATSVSRTINVSGPIATLSTSSINFGTLYLGNIVTKTVTVTNTGNLPMTISDPLIAILQGGNSNEFITLNLCPKSLAAGKNCVMTVTFIAGPFYTTQTAMLKIVDNAPPSPQIVNMTAMVINPVAQLSAQNLSFGTVTKNTSSTPKPVTITNAGATTLNITSITLAGANPGDFSAPNTCPASLAPKASCTLQVTFKPIATGPRSASLVVTTNAQNSPQSVLLTGTGH